MYCTVTTDKNFDQAVAAPDAVVRVIPFGVPHAHDLGATLRSKGIVFPGECKVHEVRSPAQAAKVLATDLRLDTALPCRVPVWTEGDATRIGMIEPEQTLAQLSGEPAPAMVAQEVGAALRQAIDKAK